MQFSLAAPQNSDAQLKANTFVLRFFFEAHASALALLTSCLHASGQSGQIPLSRPLVNEVRCGPQWVPGSSGRKTGSLPLANWQRLNTSLAARASRHFDIFRPYDEHIGLAVRLGSYATWWQCIPVA